MADPLGVNVSRQLDHQVPGPLCPETDHDDERDDESENEREVWCPDGQRTDLRRDPELRLEGVSPLRATCKADSSPESTSAVTALLAAATRVYKLRLHYNTKTSG